MELNLKNGKLINKQKTIVDIERDLVFPLVKSSTFKKPVLTDFTQFVIITQTKPKQDTTYIQYSCPRTWEYLNDNMDYFFFCPGEFIKAFIGMSMDGFFNKFSVRQVLSRINGFGKRLGVLIFYPVGYLCYIDRKSVV